MTGITMRHQAWAIAIVLLAVLFALPQPAAAAEGESSIPLKTEISITREIKGDAAETDSDTYVLTAKEEGAPMPAGSTDGRKAIHAEGPGRASFGEIVLPKPDVYEYTVRRERNDRENMTKSYPSYEVRLIALASGRVSQIVTAEDGEKAELLFSDIADIAKAGQPKTEDPALLFPAFLLCGGAAGMVLLLLLMSRRRRGAIAVITLLLGAGLITGAFTQGAEAASLKVNLHAEGTCRDCGKTRGDGKNGWDGKRVDEGRGGGGFYWVSYTDPLTGKKEKADAYCLQPAVNSPAPDGYTSKRISPSSGEKKWQRVAKILYFADGAPGQKELNKYLKAHKSKYPDFQAGFDRYILTHYMLSYAFDPDTAFQSAWNTSIGYSSGRGYGYLSRAYQKKVKAVYDWCVKHSDPGVPNPAFSISPQTAAASYDAASGKYISAVQRITGASSKQFFNYKVPTMATMYVTHSGKKTAYAAGKTVSVYVGDSFYFAFDARRTAGITKTTVQGEEEQVMPYEITVKNRQNMGFFVASKGASANFAVTLNTVAAGQLKVKKVKQALDGKTSPEAGVIFRMWNTRYASYEAAAAASTPATTFAAEMTTDTEGTAISKKLAAGSYYVQQMTTENGYAMMSPNPAQAEVLAGTVTLVKGEPVKDRELGIRIRIVKVKPKAGSDEEDPDTEPITSAAVFGIYCSEECKEGDLVQRVSTGGEDGSGLSAPLPEGTYYIKELAAPAGGYHLSQEVDRVELQYGDDLLNAAGEYVFEYTKVNYKEEYHDVVITKSVSGGSPAQSFLFDIRLSGIRAEDQVSAQIDRAGGSEAVPFAITEGVASLEGLGISPGDSIVIQHMPVESRYEISERETGNWRPSFKVTTDAQVQTRYNSGDVGGSLSVKETVAGAGNEEPILYQWNNSMEIRHSLQINKKSTGIGKDDTDVFDFQVDFKDLGGRAPGYRIFDTETKKTIESAAEEETEETEAAFSISMTSGQSVIFSGIAPGARYQITEAASDYIPGYEAREIVGTIPKVQDTGTANEPLSTGVGTMPDAASAQRVIFDFTNAAVPETEMNTVYVTKNLPAGSEEEFSFKADFTGLDPDTAYAAVREGSSTYTLSANRTEIEVRQGSAGTGGVPVTIMRSDGKVKRLMTGTGGTISLGALQSWLGRVETGEHCIPYILSWYGGEIEVGEETVTSTAENLAIGTFSSDADGNAAYSFTLKNGEGIRFDNVKEGAKYTVTELASRFEPSYTIDRTGEHGGRRIDSAGGGTRTDLTTAEQTMPAGSAAADNVVFTNSAATKCLKLTKFVESESARRFPFTIHLSGLTGVQYYAVKEGDAQAKIASDRDGNFTISITGSSCFSVGGDLSGIPVRIIRSDGADRTMCTDAQGKIAQSLYRSWLTEVGSDKNYTVEFLGQTFSANWETD